MSRRIRRRLSGPGTLHAAIREVLWGCDACVLTVDCSHGELSVCGFQDERAASLNCPGHPMPCWVVTSEPTEQDCSRIVSILRDWHRQEPSAFVSWDVWREIDDILREDGDA